MSSLARPYVGDSRARGLRPAGVRISRAIAPTHGCELTAASIRRWAHAPPAGLAAAEPEAVKRHASVVVQDLTIGVAPAGEDRTFRRCCAACCTSLIDAGARSGATNLTRGTVCIAPASHGRVRYGDAAGPPHPHQRHTRARRHRVAGRCVCATVARADGTGARSAADARIGPRQAPSRPNASPRSDPTELRGLAVRVRRTRGS